MKSRRKDYFFSGWIEKAGVLPWLRSAALRFFPIFFCLDARRFFVTRVFDTISMLLLLQLRPHHDINQWQGSSWSPFFKALLLPLRTQAVKAIALLGLFFCFNGPILADEAGKTIIISTGEHREIRAFNIEKFTVTSPNVVSYQHRKDQQNILIKGASPGHSEIVLWQKGGPKKVHQVYVFNQGDLSARLQLEQVFSDLGMQVRPYGPLISISGEVQKLSDYQLIHRLKEKYRDGLTFFRAQLDPKLTKKIISEVYLRFFEQFKDSVSCWPERISIHCEYEKSDPPAKQDLAELEERFHINFRPKSRATAASKNYHVRLKIIQEERLDGREISFGLERIESSAQDIFDQGLNSLISNNHVVLKEQNLDVSTLARPELVMRPGEPGLVSIGSDIPFQAQNQYGQANTQWRFAGLKINLSLTPQDRHIHLDYQMEFSRPEGDIGQQSVSGSREKASLLLAPNRATKLFQVMFQTTGQRREKIPGLGHIPWVGKIFQSQGRQQTYKRITGYLIVKPRRVSP